MVTFTTYTPDCNYLTGCWFATGSTGLNANGVQACTMKSADRALLEMIKTRFAIRNAVLSPEKKLEHQLTIGGSEVFDALEELGMELPNDEFCNWHWVFDEIAPPFIRGFFDGCGEVYFDGQLRVVFKSESWTLPELLQLVLQEEAGITGRLIEEEDVSFLKLDHLESRQLAKLMYGSMGPNELFLTRKKTVFDAALVVAG